MRGKRPYYFLLILVLPALFVLQKPQISEPVHEISLTVLKPLFLAGHSLADLFRQGYGTFWRLAESFKNHEDYRRRIAELEAEVHRFQETGKENIRLKKLLDFRQSLDQKTIAARVIGWDPSAWRRTVILDKGKQHGLKKDMAILSPGGLAGRILEAGPQSSRAILLTDPDSRVSALASESRTMGLVAGDGSRKLKMLHIDFDSGISVGETVMVGAASGVYPQNIRIGKIAALRRDPNGLHLEALVEPFVKFSQLEEVLCIASSREK